MKLLYLSCHSVLEYDELKLFSELGIEVFSHGAYRNPQAGGDNMRPALNIPFNKRLFDISVVHDKENLHPDMINWADVIVCSHVVDWLSLNWSKLKGKRVIWRSIGQSTLNVENMLRPLRADGLEIVRYSPRERTIPGYVGEDRMIRFYKDPDEFKGWTGEIKQVMTIGQSMKDRKDFCNYQTFEESTRSWPRKLYGTPSKEEDPLYSGQQSYEALKGNLRSSRAYFYTGTYPASYTLNFIEAWMTGIPIVAIGRVLGNSPYEHGQNTYEIPDFFEETAGGLFSDDPEELKNYLKQIMDDDQFAFDLSRKGREGAIKFFGRDRIKEEWKEFLNV